MTEIQKNNGPGENQQEHETLARFIGVLMKEIKKKEKLDSNSEESRPDLPTCWPSFIGMYNRVLFQDYLLVTASVALAIFTAWLAINIPEPPYRRACLLVTFVSCLIVMANLILKGRKQPAASQQRNPDNQEPHEPKGDNHVLTAQPMKTSMRIGEATIEECRGASITVRPYEIQYHGSQLRPAVWLAALQLVGGRFLAIGSVTMNENIIGFSHLDKWLLMLATNSVEGVSGILRLWTEATFLGGKTMEAVIVYAKFSGDLWTITVMPDSTMPAENVTRVLERIAAHANALEKGLSKS